MRMTASIVGIVVLSLGVGCKASHQEPERTKTKPTVKKPPPLVDPSVLEPQRLEELAESTDWSELDAAVASVRKARNGKEVLVRRISSEKGESQLVACWILARLGTSDRAAVAALQSALKSSSSSVRHAAAIALPSLLDGNGWVNLSPTLIGTASRRNPDYEKNLEILTGLLLDPHLDIVAGRILEDVTIPPETDPMKTRDRRKGVLNSAEDRMIGSDEATTTPKRKTKFDPFAPQVPEWSRFTKTRMLGVFGHRENPSNQTEKFAKLADALETASPEVRWAAADTLGRMLSLAALTAVPDNATKAVKSLLTLAKTEPNRAVRARVVGALGQIAGPALGQIKAAQRDEMLLALKMAHSDRDAYVRLVAAHWMWKINEDRDAASETLLATLKHEDAVLRWAAVKVIGKLRRTTSGKIPDKTVDVIDGLRTDDSFMVRVAAMAFSAGAM